MFSANATCHLDLFTHGITRTVDANGGVAFRNTGAISEISEAAAFDVDCGERLAIFGLHVFKEGVEAPTNFVLTFGHYCRELLQVGYYPRDFLKGPSGFAVVIDDGISKHAIEPCNDFLFIADFTVPLEAL